jgi:hypothetical protein
MLNRFFGKGGSQQGSSGGQYGKGQETRRSFGRKKKLIQDDGHTSRLGNIRKNMEEEHFASGVTKDTVTMADKLGSHKGGTLFKYAVIGSAPSEERTGIISRLKTYKAPSKVSSLNISDIPAIRLFGDAIEFPMTDALKHSGSGPGEDYCLIDSVLIHFVPLDSFLNDKSVITIQLNDFRKITGTAVRIAKVDNTMAYNILFSLDFCVETRDLDKMTLSFACPQKDFQDGVAWGAVKVIAQVAFLSFPKRLPVIETLAVAIFADTDLQEYEWDPREIDAVLAPQALKGLREAYNRGEIENLTLPRDDKISNNVARTIMGKSMEESSPSEAIEAMRQAALQRSRLESGKVLGSSAGADPNELIRPLKSAMKPRVSPPVSHIGSSSNNGDDVSPDDSMSVQGMGDDLSELGDSPPKDKRITRFTG